MRAGADRDERFRSRRAAAPGPKVLGLAIIAVLIAAAPLAAAAELRIRVVGLRSGEGSVEFAVYDSPETFPKREGRIAKGAVRAKAGGVTIKVGGLAPGTYAVAVFHDENGNGAFDQGFFGIPLEDYGFSNGAAAFFGPPSFSQAAFRLGPEGGEITIRLDD